MNKYLHVDGMQISMQDSFALMNAAQNTTIRGIGKMLAESPGTKENAFTVEAQKIRHPGGTVQQCLVITTGDVMFPNGEMFAADSYEVRIPIEQAPGTRYIVIKHFTGRQTKGTFSSRYQVDDEYLMCQDVVRIYIRSGVTSVAIDGSELIIAKFTYTDDMNNPSIEDLRALYCNMWSTSELIDPETAPIWSEVRQYYHNLMVSNVCWNLYMNDVDFIIRGQAFLTSKAMLEIAEAPREFWMLTSTSPGGASKCEIYSLLPHTSNNPSPIRTFIMPGLRYDVVAQRVDCYRNVVSAESDPVSAVGGTSGNPGLNMSAGWCGDCDGIWVQALTVTNTQNCFIQIWGSDSGNTPTGYPLFEIPARYPVEGAPRIFIPIDPDLTKYHVTGRVVNGSNEVKGIQMTTVISALSLGGANASISYAIGPDPYTENSTTFSSDMRCRNNDAGTKTSLFTYTNISGVDEHLVGAKLVNDCTEENGSDSTAGNIVVVGMGDTFELEIDDPTGATPFESSWVGDILIEPGHKLEFTIKDMGASDNFCRMGGIVQLMLRREE